jgi:hypothetical protein
MILELRRGVVVVVLFVEDEEVAELEGVVCYYNWAPSVPNFTPIVILS